MRPVLRMLVSLAVFAVALSYMIGCILLMAGGTLSKVMPSSIEPALNQTRWLAEESAAYLAAGIGPDKQLFAYSLLAASVFLLLVMLKFLADFLTGRHAA